MKNMRSVALALVLATTAATGHAQVVDKKGLTLDGARKVIAAAIAEAKSKNAPGGAIAVVERARRLSRSGAIR